MARNLLALERPILRGTRCAPGWRATSPLAQALSSPDLASTTRAQLLGSRCTLHATRLPATASAPRSAIGQSCIRRRPHILGRITNGRIGVRRPISHAHAPLMPTHSSSQLTMHLLWRRNPLPGTVQVRYKARYRTGRGAAVQGIAILLFWRRVPIRLLKSPICHQHGGRVSGSPGRRSSCLGCRARDIVVCCVSVPPPAHPLVPLPAPSIPF